MNTQAPGFIVTKDAHHTPSDEVNKYAAPGELVKYDIVAENNGNVDLTGVVVADPMFAGRPYTPLFGMVSADDEDVR